MQIVSSEDDEMTSYFLGKINISQEETIFVKGQLLFSGKNKKNITNLLSAELAQRVVKISPSVGKSEFPPYVSNNDPGQCAHCVGA